MSEKLNKFFYYSSEVEYYKEWLRKLGVKENDEENILKWVVLRERNIKARYEAMRLATLLTGSVMGAVIAALVIRG